MIRKFSVFTSNSYLYNPHFKEQSKLTREDYLVIMGNFVGGGIRASIMRGAWNITIKSSILRYLYMEITRTLIC